MTGPFLCGISHHEFLLFRWYKACLHGFFRGLPQLRVLRGPVVYLATHPSPTTNNGSWVQWPELHTSGDTMPWMQCEVGTTGGTSSACAMFWLARWSLSLSGALFLLASDWAVGSKSQTASHHLDSEELRKRLTTFISLWLITEWPLPPVGLGHWCPR